MITGRIIYSTIRELGVCGSRKFKKWGEIAPDTRVAIGTIYDASKAPHCYGNYSVEQAQAIIENFYKAGRVCNDGFIIVPVDSPIAEHV